MEGEEGGGGGCDWETLPMELLVEIFLMLPHYRGLHAAMLVCRKWSRASSDDYLIQPRPPRVVERSAEDDGRDEPRNVRVGASIGIGVTFEMLPRRRPVTYIIHSAVRELRASREEVEKTCGSTTGFDLYRVALFSEYYPCSACVTCAEGHIHDLRKAEPKYSAAEPGHDSSSSSRAMSRFDRIQASYSALPATILDREAPPPGNAPFFFL